jgi:hypothetical protein
MGNKLELLEHEIAELNARELSEFRAWFARFDVAAWDRQIEDDAVSGKLDVLAEQALTTHRSGQTISL